MAIITLATSFILTTMTFISLSIIYRYSIYYIYYYRLSDILIGLKLSNSSI
jgi:hypothetical protein